MFWMCKSKAILLQQMNGRFETGLGEDLLGKREHQMMYYEA